jgi:hypothetical protein
MSQQSKFQLVFDFESIFSGLEDPLESIDDLTYFLEEICTKTVETIEHFDQYEDDTNFTKYDDVDDLIDKVKTRFNELIEKAVYNDDASLLEEFGTDCPILPPFGGDDYTLTLNFEEVEFGRLGQFASHSIFEETTRNKDVDEKLDMMVNTWVLSEKKGYAYEGGKQDLTDISDEPFFKYEESIINIYF